MTCFLIEFLSSCFSLQFQYFIVSTLDLFKFVRPKVHSSEAEDQILDEHQNVAERHNFAERRNNETNFPMLLGIASGSGDPADQVTYYENQM
jgi:hypothetical protein